MKFRVECGNTAIDLSIADDPYLTKLSPEAREQAPEATNEVVDEILKEIDEKDKPKPSNNPFTDAIGDLDLSDL